MFDPLIVCGQQSLAVFCVGVFLSFVGHFELMMSSGSLFAQIFVSVTGIAIMTIVAYYISCRNGRTNRFPRQPPPRPASSGLTPRFVAASRSIHADGALAMTMLAMSL